MKTRVLRRRLKEGRRSQNAWAKYLGLSKGHLSDLVNGKHLYPSRTTREKLLTGLDLCFDDLFTIEPSSPACRRPPSPSARSRGRPHRSWIRPVPLSLIVFFRVLGRNLDTVLIAGLAMGLMAGVWVVVEPLVWTPAGGRDIVVLTEGPRQAPSWLNYLELRQRSRTLSRTAAFLADIDLPVADQRGTQLVRAAVVTQDFFAVFGVDAERGTLTVSRAADDHRVPVIISKRLWASRYLSSPATLGAEVKVNGIPGRIAGVAPEHFRFPDEAGMWVPHWSLPWGVSKRTAYNLSGVVGRLAAGTRHQELNRELAAISVRMAQLHPELSGDFQLTATPLREYLVRPVRPELRLFLLLVFVFTLVALLSGLTGWLRRLIARADEYRLRVLLGSTPGRLVAEGGAHSALVVTGSLLIAIPAARITASLLLDLSLIADARIIPQEPPATMVAILVFTGLQAVGFIAILAAASYPVVKSALHCVSCPRTPASLGACWVAVAVQFGLSAFLLISGLFLALDWHRLAQVNPGFSANQLIAYDLRFPTGSDAAVGDRGEILRFQARLINELERVPGVQSASLDFSPPLSPGLKVTSPAIVERNGVPVEPLDSDFRIVGPNYFRTTGTRVLAGRDFTLRDNLESERVAVVNRAFARKAWGNASPLGRKILVPGQIAEQNKEDYWMQVVGVVQDVRSRSLRRQPRPAVYAGYLQYPVRAPYMTLIVSVADSPREVAAIIPQVLLELDRDIPAPSPQFLAARLEAGISRARLRAKLVALVWVLTCLAAGFASLNFILMSLRERRFEIGVRLVLGARNRHVVSLLGRSLCAVALLGAALAFGLLFLLPNPPGKPGTEGLGLVLAVLVSYSVLFALFTETIVWWRSRRMPIAWILKTTS